MVWVFLLLLGADPGLVSTTTEDDFVLRLPGTAVTTRLTADHVQGSVIDLGRYGHELRGSVGRHAVDLSWDDHRVSGPDGGSQTNLTYTVAEGGLRIKGLLHSRYANFLLSASIISGTVAGRSYTLVAMPTHHGTVYSGQVNATSAMVAIPRGAQKLAPGELVAVVAMLLGH
jgi:hypothetical protein